MYQDFLMCASMYYYILTCVNTFYLVLIYMLKICLTAATTYCKSIYTKIQRFSVRYLKKSELINRIRSFMNQFVRYIHGKVCSLSSI